MSQPNFKAIKGRKAKACPKCGKAVVASFNVALVRAYRYSVECHDCSVWSYGTSALKALERWQAGDYCP